MIRRQLLAAGRRLEGVGADRRSGSVEQACRVDRRPGCLAIDAEVWEEPVRTVADLWSQRLRWAEGALRRAFEHGPSVAASPALPPAARLDFVAYVGQLVVPAVVAGACASAIVTGRRRSLVSIVAGYLGVSALLGWDALRWTRAPDGSRLASGERLRRSLRVALFSGVWLFVVPCSLLDLVLRRGPIRYKKMEHEGVGDPVVDAGRRAADRL